MTSSNGNIFRATGHLCGEFTVPRGALMFSLICVWINDWVNNREAGDLRRYRTHYDVIVMGPRSHPPWRAVWCLLWIFINLHLPLVRDHLVVKTTLGVVFFERLHCSLTLIGYPMMASSNGNIFRVTDPLYGEFTGHRWIPRTKASDAELWCFLWFAPE